jgi:hypothetical protein
MRILITGLILSVTLPQSTAGSACEVLADPWLTLSVSIREGDEAGFDCALPQVHIDGHDPTDIWGNTPLHMAAKYDQAALATRLLEAGADINRANAANATPLRMAIDRSADDTAATLILLGANLEFADAQGRTALFWAVTRNNLPITRLLLREGADPHQVLTLFSGSETLRDYALRTAAPGIRSVFEEVSPQ